MKNFLTVVFLFLAMCFQTAYAITAQQLAEITKEFSSGMPDGVVELEDSIDPTTDLDPLNTAKEALNAMPCSGNRFQLFIKALLEAKILELEFQKQLNLMMDLKQKTPSMKMTKGALDSLEKGNNLAEFKLMLNARYLAEKQRCKKSEGKN